MALTDENGGMNTTMLVSPTNGFNNGAMPYPYPVYPNMGSGNGNNSNGFGGEGGWWLILLIILFAAGGWGNNNGNGGAFGGQPIIVNDGASNSVQRGFDQAAIMSGINSLQVTGNNLSTQLCNCCSDMQMSMANGFANTNQNILSGTASIQNSLCNGFNGVNTTINSAQNAVTTQLYNNELASLNRSFAEQTANTQGFNSLNSQLANCCCENRAGIADLKYTIATENCADRAAISDGIRDVITAQTASTQRILDQLCNDKIDAKNERIADLERQLTMANLAASQTAQTAAIRAGQVAEIDAMYNRLRDCPVPTMPVYGSQPIFTCPNNNNNGCGCGCGNNF